MTTYILFTAIFCLGTMIAVLYANPSRVTNRAYAGLTFLMTAWFACVYKTIRATTLLPANVESVIFWHRTNAAVAALFPWVVWLLKESISDKSGSFVEIISRSYRWVVPSLALICLSLGNDFAYVAPPYVMVTRGLFYFAYSATTLATFIVFVVQCHRQVRTLSGIRRIEMQFFTLNFGYMILIAMVLTGLGNLLHVTAVKNASVAVILLSFVVTAWAITMHRIFDARHVFFVVTQRTLVVAIAVLFVWVAALLLKNLLPVPSAMLVAVAGAACGIFWIERQTRQLLGLADEQILGAMRRDIIHTARTEASTARLTSAFEELLAKMCHANAAQLLFETGSSYRSSRLEFSRNRTGYATLCESGWATPESIQRQRHTGSRLDLVQFLTEHSLGLMLAIPQGSANPSLLIAFGRKPNEWPYTYPEVRRLQNIGELIDNILTRSRLTTQAALKAKTEHLAMMSRGLAHDLKNLLTPVSSFLVHTEGRFPSETIEAEVHAAAQRSVRIMGEYVREARFFADQLQPRYETIRLRPIVESVQELMSSRAAARGVKIVLALAGDDSMTADRVLVQRLVANLVANAIDASASGNPVTISAACSTEHVRLQVADTGCGIPPENLSRIFEAYFTTKEFGDDVRGFGLGLTICQKIVALHRGTIVVDSEIGRGTTITVDLPRSQSSPDERARQPEVQTARDD